MQLRTENIGELKKKSRNVEVFRGYAYFKKRTVVEFGRDEFSNLRKFLDKFGRRLFINDFIDILFGMPAGPTWKIDFQLLYSGYKLYEENREKFNEAVQKCRSKTEFLIVCGMR